MIQPAQVIFFILFSVGGIAWSEASQATRTVLIPAGEYLPFFKEAPSSRLPRPLPDPKAEPLPVAAFLMDIHPVTIMQFKAFLAQNPNWRRSSVKRLFADEHYLEDWVSDLEGPKGRDAASPVTFVSWFAARAYCEFMGKALPTIAQWEYVADNRGRDGAKIARKILDWYAKPSSKNPDRVARGHPNSYMIHDLYDLVWEWTVDFSSALMANEARASGEEQNPLFCGSGSIGSRDPSDYVRFMRYGFRSSLKADFTTRNLGFRCIKEILK